LTPAAPTVHVVDDDPAVRRGLARLLGTAGYAVRTHASAAEFLAGPPPAGPSCLLLDMRMPGITGLELQDTLAATGRRTTIVFVTGHADVPMSVRALKRGAVDLLTKPVDQADLLAAVRRALARDAAARGEEDRAADVRQRFRQLTAREAEVFAHVVTGMLNKQIAAALGISEKTVKVHRARVMEKMRAGSVAELTRLADRLGVILPKA
jgi:FixJ family two-component response regulator